MEPEILKSRETETGHIQQKFYPIAPAYCLNYKHIINTQGVAKVSVLQIKRLAEKLSPNYVFPQIEGFSDNQFQELAEKLDTIEDIQFLYTLCNIIFMCSDEGIDVLRQCGVNINTEYQGEQVVSAYFSNPEGKFEIALNRLLFTSVATSKTCYIFKVKAQIPRIANLQTVEQRVNTKCRNYFKNLNCKTRVIHPIREDNRLGFFIEHPGNLKSKAFIDLQNKMSLFRGRSLIEDFIIYDSSLGLAFISSRSLRNCEFYSEVLGTVFCNNESIFEQHQLNLHFVKKQSVRQLLTNCCVERIMQVQIKRIRSVVKTMNKNQTIELRPPTGSGCLTHNNSNLVIEGDIVEIELKIKLNIGTKDRLQTLILKPTTMKSDQLISPFEIQHIFKQLELICNEND